MDEDIHHTDEEVTQSPSPNKDQPKSSHTHDTESDSDSSCLEALKKYDNVLPLTERQLSEIEGFHDAAYKVHKGTEAAFSTYKKLLVKFQAQYGKDAEKILGSFKGLKSSIEYLQASALRQDKHLAEWAKSEISSLKQDTSEIKSTMIKIFKAFKGLSSLASSSSVPTTILAITEGPTTESEKGTTKEVPTRPIRAVPISTVKPITRPNPEVALIGSFSRHPLNDTILEIPIPQPTGPVIDITLLEQPESPPVVPKADKGKGVATKETKEPTMLVPASKEVRRDPDEPVRFPYEIHKKVVQEEATMVGVDPKILASTKGGKEFKKIQDAELQVLNREHSQKVKRQMELRKKRLEQYINFDVHNPFKFGDFGITKLDELGHIIENKKNNIVGELLISLGKRYERLNKIPEELGIQSALPALVQAQS
ncbi:hypothetical protein Tco_1212290 [Tanacetum coccineum]